MSNSLLGRNGYKLDQKGVKGLFPSSLHLQVSAQLSAAEKSRQKQLDALSQVDDHVASRKPHLPSLSPSAHSHPYSHLPLILTLTLIPSQLILTSKAERDSEAHSSAAHAAGLQLSALEEQMEQVNSRIGEVQKQRVDAQVKKRGVGRRVEKDSSMEGTLLVQEGRLLHGRMQEWQLSLLFLTHTHSLCSMCTHTHTHSSPHPPFFSSCASILLRPSWAMPSGGSTVRTPPPLTLPAPPAAPHCPPMALPPHPSLGKTPSTKCVGRDA